jgi:hypothetical protein
VSQHLGFAFLDDLVTSIGRRVVVLYFNLHGCELDDAPANAVS